MREIESKTYDWKNRSQVVDIDGPVSSKLSQRFSKWPKLELLQLLPTLDVLASNKFDDGTRQCQPNENVQRAQQHQEVARHQVTEANRCHRDETEVKAFEERPVGLVDVEDCGTGWEVESQEDQGADSIQPFPAFEFPYFWVFVADF